MFTNFREIKSALLLFALALNLGVTSSAKAEFKLDKLDYNPTSGLFVDGTFTDAMYQEFRKKLQKAGNESCWGNLEKIEQRAQKFTFAYLNNKMAAQPDIPTLAAEFCRVVGLDPNKNNITQLSYALGQALKVNDLSSPERKGFLHLLSLSGAEKSMGKKEPNKLPYEKITGNLKTIFDNWRMMIQARNHELKTNIQFYSDTTHEEEVFNRVLFDVQGLESRAYRSAHMNKAGWLPDVSHNFLVEHQASLFEKIRALVKENVKEKVQQRTLDNLLKNELKEVAVRAELEVDPEKGARIENAVNKRGDVLRKRFYEDFFFKALSEQERLQLAWARACKRLAPELDNCAYIELDGVAPASRILYDWVNDKFYLTAHYHMVDGYNPFIEVTDVPPFSEVTNVPE